MIRIILFIIIFIIFNGCSENKKCITVTDKNNTKVLTAKIMVYLLNEGRKFNPNPNILNKIQGKLIAKSMGGMVCFLDKQEDFFNNEYAIAIFNKQPFVHEVKYYNKFHLIPEEIIPTGKYDLFLIEESNILPPSESNLSIRIKDFRLD